MDMICGANLVLDLKKSLSENHWLSEIS